MKDNINSYNYINQQLYWSEDCIIFAFNWEKVGRHEETYDICQICYGISKNIIDIIWSDVEMFFLDWMKVFLLLSIWNLIQKSRQRCWVDAWHEFNIILD